MSARDDEAIFAQRLLTRELISLERAAEQSASSYAALVSAKSEMALRLAQADEDRAGLTLELSNLKERFAALSEERDGMAARSGRSAAWRRRGRRRRRTPPRRRQRRRRAASTRT